MHRHDGLRPDRALTMSTLEQKCNFKRIPLPDMKLLEHNPGRQELETEWENMLAHQLPILPPFIQFWHELPAVFEWLYRGFEKTIPPSMPLLHRAVDETWSPRAMARPWHLATRLELVRFAAANRLCVNLDYIDAQGNRRRRIIEPYSMRRSRDGNLLLYAVKHNTGEDRSYRIDRIQGAEVTEKPFIPRYLVDLTASGPTSSPPITRKSKRTVSNLGPTYVIECPYCGKRFNRKKRTTHLNPHKDKSNYPCSGKTGYVVDMKY